MAVISAGAVGYATSLYFSSRVTLTVFAVTAAVFLLASFFDYLLAQGGRHGQISALLQVLAFLGFFYTTKPVAIASAFGALAVFYILAMHGAFTAMDNSLKFKLAGVARVYMKRIFIGFTLAAILLYLPQLEEGDIFIPQPKFQKWYDGFAGFSDRFYTGIDLRATVGVFAENTARAQLSKDSRFNALPSSEQQRVIQEAAQQMIANTSRSIGLQLLPEMPLAEAFYKYLLNFLGNLKTQFGDSFLAAWAVTVFVVVISLGTLLVWATVLVAYVIFEMFLAFNVAHVAGESRTKEVVELS